MRLQNAITAIKTVIKLKIKFRQVGFIAEKGYREYQIVPPLEIGSYFQFTFTLNRYQGYAEKGYIHQ